MSRHVSDVAWSLYAALSAVSDLTVEGDAPTRASWAVSPPQLVAADPETSFSERDGTWCLFADGDLRGFKITIEKIPLEQAIEAIFDEGAREKLARG